MTESIVLVAEMPLQASISASSKKGLGVGCEYTIVKGVGCRNTMVKDIGCGNTMVNRYKNVKKYNDCKNAILYLDNEIDVVYIDIKLKKEGK